MKLPISVASVAGKQIKESKHVASILVKEENGISDWGVISCVIAGSKNKRLSFLSVRFR